MKVCCFSPSEVWKHYSRNKAPSNLINYAGYSQGLFRWRGVMKNIKQAVLEAILSLSLGNDYKSAVTENLLSNSSFLLNFK